MDDKTAIEILREIRNEMDAAGESSDVAIQHAIQAIEALEMVRVEFSAWADQLESECAPHSAGRFIADEVRSRLASALGKQEG